MRIATTIIAAMRTASASYAAPIEGGHIQMIDGDTVRIMNREPDLRLVGFNAPETYRAACKSSGRLAIEQRSAYAIWFGANLWISSSWRERAAPEGWWSRCGRTADSRKFDSAFRVQGWWIPADAEAMVQGSDALSGNAASPLPQGDDAVWQDRLVIWKESASWQPALTAWLQPRFRADAMKRLKPGVFRDLCWDDTDWLKVLGRCIKWPIETVKEDLADALLNGVIRTYHGCRTEDAGSYFREGLRVHSKDVLKARALAIIEAHTELHYMRAVLDTIIADIDNTIDDGRCYVVVSDEGLLHQAAHYLIHGSEWIMALFGESGRRILRNIGAPTLLEIDLPFTATNSSDRCGFAEDMLMEWTRLTCNGEEWIAPINITFMLSQDLPGACIVGHSHLPPCVIPMTAKGFIIRR